MKEKKFKFDAGEALIKELTVGQMKKVKAKLKVDDFEATLLMAKFSIGKPDSFIDKLSMSELNLVGDWLANPTD